MKRVNILKLIQELKIKLELLAIWHTRRVFARHVAS